LENRDIEFEGIDFSVEDGLRSAVYISLFTDIRAELEEIDEGANPRGNWTDHFEETPLGSKLWLLYRRKQTEESRLLAEQYASDSLQWLIRKGVAKSIDVDVSFPKTGLVYFDIKLYRPEEIEFEFSTNWQAEVA